MSTGCSAGSSASPSRLPLLWFAWKRAIPRGYGWKLVALLVLGGAAGRDRLVDGRLGPRRPAATSATSGSPSTCSWRSRSSRLTLWLALDLLGLAREPAAPARRGCRRSAIWTLSLLFLQFLFGAYVAGLDAGYAYSSWPKMGDEWFPADAPLLEPFLRNFVDNPIMVQFVHRWLAFAVAAAAFVLARNAWRAGHRQAAALLVGAVTVQILLGIFTLLSGVELWIAASHQGMAVLLLAAAVVAAHRLGRAAGNAPCGRRPGAAERTA